MTDTNGTTDTSEPLEESNEDRDTSSTSTSIVVERAEKHRVADEIEEWVGEAQDLAKRLGLDPYPVNYWIVDNEEMNKLATYGGFQERYPHWRWGMKYDKQRKQDWHTGSRIFEMVNNDNPAHAYLQVSNSEVDQKAVVTHVEAHADFFANNRWFRDSPDAARLLSEHARRIEEIMSRPDVDRDDVESLIDTMTCIQDTIDQTRTLLEADPLEVESRREESEDELSDIEERIEELDIPESMREQFFDEEWIEEHTDEDGREYYDDLPGFILRYGHRFDEESGEAREFEDWEHEVIRMMREEFYYFAPQKMTKIMNEGWASYWQTAMMNWEGFADADEFIEHADHHAKVLTAPGLNPYKFGRELWMHIENQENRREVVDKLLRIDGVTPENFHDEIDVTEVVRLLDHPDAYSPAKRNFSLARPENRGYLGRIDYDELTEIYRYVVDYDRYDSVDEALLDVDYTAGWSRMREIRSTHIDATFIDEFLDEEFVEERNYFVWDYNPSMGARQVSSTDPADVKQKLLLEFTNFGKPTIVVEDRNFNNRGELLLTHKYNGIQIDVEQAMDVVERLGDVWGRPVRLRTIGVTSGEDGGEAGQEIPMEIRFDPASDEEAERIPGSDIETDGEYLIPDDIDSYNTVPDEWF